MILLVVLYLFDFIGYFGVYMLESGKILRWNDEKGFGFIKPEQGGKEVFVHISAFGQILRRPLVGDEVSYQVVTIDGRCKAANVELKGVQALSLAERRLHRFRKRNAATRPRLTPLLSEANQRVDRHIKEEISAAGIKSWIFPSVVLGVVGIGALAGYWSIGVWLLYIVMSGITFRAYLWDKRAAMRSEWRTMENTLHLFALMGGWPGALLAQRLLRHKNQKDAFQDSFFITVVINILLLLGFSLYQGNLIPT